MKDFFTLLLLYAYFRFFDFRLLAGERLPSYSVWRVFFTPHDSFHDPVFKDPTGVAVHPAKTWWAFLRPIIVVAPMYLAQILSPLATARLAAIGLVLLVGPLGMPKATPMQRKYDFWDGVVAQVGAGFNNVMAVLGLGAIFYLIRLLTGFHVTVDWLFINLNLFPGHSAETHPEEIAAGAWFVALALIVIKTCIWAGAVAMQGKDGLGYPPAAVESMPFKTESARTNLFRSLGWGIAGFALGWLALCFIYNYTTLLAGYEEIGGKRTVGILMLVGLLIGHPI
jgi:hypothetical protein